MYQGVLIASALAVLLSEKHKFCCIYQILSLGFILKLVITKGYNDRRTKRFWSHAVLCVSFI